EPGVLQRRDAVDHGQLIFRACDHPLDGPARGIFDEKDLVPRRLFGAEQTDPRFRPEDRPGTDLREDRQHVPGILLPCLPPRSRFRFGPGWVDRPGAIPEQVDHHDGLAVGYRGQFFQDFRYGFARAHSVSLGNRGSTTAWDGQVEGRAAPRGLPAFLMVLLARLILGSDEVLVHLLAVRLR